VIFALLLANFVVKGFFSLLKKMLNAKGAKKIR